MHCGPCWAVFGGSPDAVDIGPAPMEALGSRDPRDQREWLASLTAEPWLGQLRRDARARVLALVRELMLRANWDSWESWPGWDRLMDVTGWARSTLAGWLRQLRLLGWLSLIESGSTAAFRPMALAHVEGNRRAVYALRVPALHRAGAPREAGPVPARPELETVTAAAAGDVAAFPFPPSDQHEHVGGEQTWTPTGFFGSSSEVDQGVSSRASEVFHNSQVRAPVRPNDEALRARLDRGWLAFAGTSPTSEAQMLAAAAELRRQEPILARLTIRGVRALCRPYWAAGWANDDVRHALWFRPSSWSRLPAMALARIVAPYRWAASRLAAWRTDAGRVLPGHHSGQQPRAGASAARERAVVARWGRGGLEAMPAGADRLCAADVRRYGRAQVDAAAQILRRRRAAELADDRDAIRPPADVAGADHVREVADRWRAEQRAERERRRDVDRQQLLDQARAAAAELAAGAERGQDQAVVNAIAWTPPGPAQTPQERHALALARARAEGRSPGAGRRRRVRW